MSWKDKLVGATIIYEILIVLPVVLFWGSMADSINQLFTPDYEWGWVARIVIVIVLNGFYGMGLLLIMGFIDFARRPNDTKTINPKWIKGMEIGRE